MTMKHVLLTLCLMCGVVIVVMCRGKQSKDAPKSECELLKIKQDLLIERAKKLAPDGWLVKDCDGFEYSALANVGGVPGFDPLTAEYGRGVFERRPGSYGKCDTSWSRDMATGLIWWFWKGLAAVADRIQLLKEHMEYAFSHHFIMGYPESDTRLWYSPQLIGMFYQVLYALGGPNSVYRAFPAIYPKGLTGYERRLQLLDIALHGDMAEKLHDANNIPHETHDISLNMWQRIKEAYQDDEKDVLAASLYGIYGGDFNRVFYQCQNEIYPDYEACENCGLAMLIFSCSLVLQRCTN